MSFIDFVIITKEFFGILETSRTVFIEISEYKNNQRNVTKWSK